MQDYQSNQEPAISVILPVYNGGSYLPLSVQSVLNQTFQHFEFLIVDDCSSDGSLDYVDGLNDPRIQLFRNERNRGLFFNLNFLIGKSRGSLIKLWAQDDVMYPCCLKRFVDFHLANPGIGFSYSGRDIIDEYGKVLQNNTIDETPALISTALHTRIAYYTGSIAGNIANVCINKAAFDKVGEFNEKMKISADFEMWVRLAKDHPTGFIPEKLIQLRDHPKQLSRKASLYLEHAKEDLTVYSYLNSYVSEVQKAEGRKLMRSHKLVFYYTLMLKELIGGNLNNAYKFYRAISGVDSFFKISLSFFRIKILKQSPPKFHPTTK